MSTFGVQNLTYAIVSGGFNATQTFFNLPTGSGARFTVFPERAVLWNTSDYRHAGEAFWAGQAEIIQLNSVGDDQLTAVDRAQEGTTGITSIAGKTYEIHVVQSRAVLLDLASRAPMAIIEDRKTSGAKGGSFSAGDPRTRDLNVVVYDPSGIVTSLSSNQFTLEAGTYHIFVTAPSIDVQENQLRLYNVSDMAEVCVGECAVSYIGSSLATLEEVFIIGAQKIFEIQHECLVSRPTFGFGTYGFGSYGVYTRVILVKLD